MEWILLDSGSAAHGCPMDYATEYPTGAQEGPQVGLDLGGGPESESKNPSERFPFLFDRPTVELANKSTNRANFLTFF